MGSAILRQTVWSIEHVCHDLRLSFSFRRTDWESQACLPRLSHQRVARHERAEIWLDAQRSNVSYGSTCGEIGSAPLGLCGTCSGVATFMQAASEIFILSFALSTAGFLQAGGHSAVCPSEGCGRHKKREPAMLAQIAWTPWLATRKGFGSKLMQAALQHSVPAKISRESSRCATQSNCCSEVGRTGTSTMYRTAGCFFQCLAGRHFHVRFEGAESPEVSSSAVDSAVLAASHELIFRSVHIFAIAGLVGTSPSPGFFGC